MLKQTNATKDQTNFGNRESIFDFDDMCILMHVKNTLSDPVRVSGRMGI